MDCFYEMAGFSGSRAAGDERGPGVAIARQPPSRRLLSRAQHTSYLKKAFVRTVMSVC